MTNQTVRIATRASRLALWQANFVAAELRRLFPECVVELIEISTEGDRDQTEPLHTIGSLGVFTREVQRAVLDQTADIAVHSLKDLPTEPVAGLCLGAVPQRASMFDVLVLPENTEAQKSASQKTASPLDLLPNGCSVATGSIRRRAQLLYHRPDLQLCEVRGNIETRLRKLDDGQFDALILAEAALQRLELSARISAVLQPPLMFPAVSQGALGIECRADDSPRDQSIRKMLAALTDDNTYAAVSAERTLLAELRAGCHAPLGVLSSFSKTAEPQFTLESVVLSPDGSEKISASVTGPITETVAIGREVAQQLAALGAERLVTEAGENR